MWRKAGGAVPTVAGGVAAACHRFPAGAAAIDDRDLGPDLARILPELGDLPAGITANPDTERFRLFEGVAAMLSATSAVVVVDDLQWADRSTLLLLRHIVRSAENVLVVATCRDGETDRTA